LKTSQIVEAVLFASDAPLKAEEIARADEALDEDQVEEALQVLRDEYAETERAFQVVEVAEGYQIVTLSDFAPYLERFDTVPRPSRLSGPALETLAIIAYRQPIGRIEVEYIRGVSSSGVIRTLQDRAMIEVVGRAEGIGRPLLYGTTTRFLEHFGFRSLDALPRPEELPVVLRDNPPLDEDPDAEPRPETADSEAGEGEGGTEGSQEELGLAAGEGGDREEAATSDDVPPTDEEGEGADPALDPEDGEERVEP
jgi:segregation and condensation protein B